jgi:hypothetical protein
VVKTRCLGGVKLSVTYDIDTIEDVQFSVPARLFIRRVLQLLGTIVILGFLWSFALPLIGLLIVTSRFFSG